MVRIAVAGLLLFSSTARVSAAQSPGDLDAARRVVATLELAAREYSGAWSTGGLTDSLEWQEARLFVGQARIAAGSLPENIRSEVTQRITMIEQRLAAKMPPDSLAIATHDVTTRLTNIFGVSLDERPAREPSLANGAVLYRSTCQRCHGISGRGDGEVALRERFTPPPANLADSAAMASVTPLDIYRKISLGVPGTKMQPFGEALSREERWDLVAYVLTLSSPAGHTGRTGQIAVVFGTVRSTLNAAMETASHGSPDAAAGQVLDAYMAFEAVEGALGASNPGIVRQAEQRFSALRMALKRSAPHTDAVHAHDLVLSSLVDAERALTEERSRAGLFVESLLLMLREGFEAILVVGAIMAVLVKAEAREKQRHVRLGVGAALIASLVTAAVLELIVRVTPSQRESLEGAIMLVAAAVLFYVSFWLISKVEVAAWTRFVKGQIQRAVESGSGIALASVAFLAVYREGFETVLFYKALYVTGGPGGAGAVTAGLVAGLAGLVVVFFGIERFGLRIPMRPFFAATGATLSFMAFVFAGDGVKELQEGGYIGSTLLSWAPRADFFGIYPTLESLGVQAVILLALLVALLWTFVIAPRREARYSSPASSPTRRQRRTQARRSGPV